MTLEEMKFRKAEFGLTSEMIAEASGIPLGTVQKIFGGTTKSPRKRTIEAIEHVFQEEATRKRRSEALFSRPAASVVQETAWDYKLKEEALYTIDDYYALPEERRVELIDGKFYDMTAPSRGHQLVLGELYLLFRECADKHDMPCEVYLSPCDVRLDRDNYTMVQPDLLIVCHYDDPDIRRIEGAPDLVVEILSPSTRMKDQTLKLYKYQNAGVREYWIVDLKNRTVTVHYFENEQYHPEYYHFNESVPVHISDGECSIDFSGILKKLESHGW